jgi:hypothetical protein
VQKEVMLKILSDSPLLPKELVNDIIAYNIAKLKIKEASTAEQKMLITQCKKSGWKAKFGGFGDLQPSTTIKGFTLEMSEIQKTVSSVYLAEGSRMKTELETTLDIKQETKKYRKFGI